MFAMYVLDVLYESRGQGTSMSLNKGRETAVTGIIDLDCLRLLEGGGRAWQGGMRTVLGCGGNSFETGIGAAYYVGGIVQGRVNGRGCRCRVVVMNSSKDPGFREFPVLCLVVRPPSPAPCEMASSTQLLQINPASR